MERNADGRLVLDDAAQLNPDPGSLPMHVTTLRLNAPGFAEADGVLAGWFIRHRCAAALVRPDHYVYGVACDAQQLLTLLDRLQHQMSQGE